MRTVEQQACPCGSGLRAARCCKLDLETVAPSEAGRHLRPLVERAVEAERAGEHEAAAMLCLEVLELSPGERDCLWLLSRIREAQGLETAAEALVRRLVALNPDGLPATLDLALRLMRKGAMAEAELHARNAVRLAPQNAQSHNLLGMALTELHQSRTAEFHYRRALELSGRREPILLANLAWCLKQQGRMQEARELYQESTASGPEVFQTLLGWARLEEADRRFVEAGALLDRADAASPGHPGVLLERAVLRGRLGDAAGAIALLDAEAAARGDAGLGPEQWLEKGRLLDRIGHHGEAFAAFAEGKRRGRELSGQDYRAEAAERLVARLTGFFTASRLATLPRAGCAPTWPSRCSCWAFRARAPRWWSRR